MKKFWNHWQQLEHEQKVLRYVQPSLVGLIDGVLASLGPILAAAYLAGSKEAFLIGLAVAFSSAISMGFSEAMSDDGEITNRGTSLARGILTGVATFLGAIVHVLPFLIQNVSTALAIAYVIIAIELVGIAWIRKKFLKIALPQSFVQITLGGLLIVAVGILLGHG